MRVLCLHGMGTNAGILEAQTGKPCKRLLHPDDQSANQPTEMFRSLLPKHFEYEFFDADNEYPAAEGCADIFPGPYYCFYPVPTTNNVELAHQYVQEIIEEEGPFDAVMGFSQVGHVLLTRYFSNFLQGAALAASILLRHQDEKPFEPAPFRFAVFICGSLPYWVDTNKGTDVAGLFLRPSDTGFGAPVPLAYQPALDDGSADSRPMAQRGLKVPRKPQSIIDELERRFSLADMNDERWDQVPIASGVSDDDSGSDADSDGLPTIFSPGDSASSGGSTFSPATDSEGEEGEEGFDWETKPYDLGPVGAGDHVVRRLHPSVDRFRIDIPTAHIYGSKDPYYRQSLGLTKLCNPQWASTYEHGEGHIVPRSKSVNAKIATTIGRTLAMVDAFSR